MNDINCEELIDKVMRVILSCKTVEQLSNAETYANLAFNKLAKHPVFTERARFLCLIERSIGFAQCSIKSKFTIN